MTCDRTTSAKYHFLVLPRIPLQLQPSSTEEYDIDYTGILDITPSDISSLTSLLATDHALIVLKHLETAALECKEMIEDEMLKTEGWVWDVEIAFHAVPSMR